MGDASPFFPYVSPDIFAVKVKTPLAFAVVSKSEVVPCAGLKIHPVRSKMIRFFSEAEPGVETESISERSDICLVIVMVLERGMLVPYMLFIN